MGVKNGVPPDIILIDFILFSCYFIQLWSEICINYYLY